LYVVKITGLTWAVCESFNAYVWWAVTCFWSRLDDFLYVTGWKSLSETSVERRRRTDDIEAELVR
jgi:hypothetical protein